MDDLSEKLSGILNDPEAMRDIAALASQLGVDASGVHTKPEPKPEPQSDDNTAKLISGLMPMLKDLPLFDL